MEDYNQEMDNDNDNDNENVKMRKTSKPHKPKERKTGTNVIYEEYFEAFKHRNDFISSENEAIQKFDFTVESHNEILDQINKNKLCKQFLNEQKRLENSEKINTMNEMNLFDLIAELLRSNSNIFLYGYGSKLRLMYDFITYFQEYVNGRDNENYHILIFNCYNPEMNLRFILNEIQAYLTSILKEIYGLIKPGCSGRYSTTEEHIHIVSDILSELQTMGFQGKFLLILNSIDGCNFLTKSSQQFLSTLSHSCRISLIVSCDNMYVNFLWNQEMKDKFSFYFLKFHTLEPYDTEVTNRNSLSGETNIKTGSGFAQIFNSLTKIQKDLIKVMAEIQLKGEWNKMTIKSLVDYLIDSGSGLCNSQNRFVELVLEPMDHDVIITKIIPKTNKEIYKLNLENEILEKIIAGAYDGEIE